MTGHKDRAERQQENLWDICFIGFFIFRGEKNGTARGKENDRTRFYWHDFWQFLFIAI